MNPKEKSAKAIRKIFNELNEIANSPFTFKLTRKERTELKRLSDKKTQP